MLLCATAALAFAGATVRVVLAAAAGFATAAFAGLVIMEELVFAAVASAKFEL